MPFIFLPSWNLLPSLFRHRAGTTGSVGFIRLLVESSTPSNKLRLNTGDRMGISLLSCPAYLCLLNFFHQGNTPLHLAMDSAHAEAAVVLINAGADRSRVGSPLFCHTVVSLNLLQENLDRETAEQIEGVGGQEQKLARKHVVELCGKP